LLILTTLLIFVVLLTLSGINMSTFYQIVFGSKDCTEFLNLENQGSLFGYIVGILRKM